MAISIISTTPKITAGGIAYKDYLINNSGDLTRILVPNGIVKGFIDNVIVWGFHGSDGNQGAVDGGHKNYADRALAKGWVFVSPNLDGTQYTQLYVMELVKALDRAKLGLGITIGHTFLIGTSMGGSQAAWITGRGGVVTNLRASYHVNGVYDIEAEPVITRTVDIFPDQATLEARNPKRLAISAWSDRIVRVVYDDAGGDQYVIPESHAIPFEARVNAAGGNATHRTHQSGHSTPSFAGVDAFGYFVKVLESL